MNLVRASALSLALLSFAAASQAQTSPSAVAGVGTGVPTIAPKDLSARMNGGNVTVIDVGTKADFGQAHIAGAKWDTAEEISIRNLPDSHEDTVVFYCKTDPCAQTAAMQAANAGWGSVFVLSGGLEAWKAAGLPVTGAKSR